MSDEELSRRLKQLKIEDFIWIIYMGIIIMSLYSNIFERDYFINNNQKSKEKYREMTIGIFVILVVIYIYFLKDSYDDLKNIKPSDSNKKRNLLILSFIGSLLITISGFIFIYILINDENVDVEIAFN